MTELILKLKKEVIAALNLDMSPEDIDDDAPLFGDGLALDSIDALELIVILEDYGIRIKNDDDATKAFQSMRHLAQFIQDNRK